MGKCLYRKINSFEYMQYRHLMCLQGSGALFPPRRPLIAAALLAPRLWPDRGIDFATSGVTNAGKRRRNDDLDDRFELRCPERVGGFLEFPGTGINRILRDAGDGRNRHDRQHDRGIDDVQPRRQVEGFLHPGCNDDHAEEIAAKIPLTFIWNVLCGFEGVTFVRMYAPPRFLENT